MGMLPHRADVGAGTYLRFLLVAIRCLVSSSAFLGNHESAEVIDCSFLTSRYRRRVHELASVPSV